MQVAFSHVEFKKHNYSTKKSFRKNLNSHSERLYSLALVILNVCTEYRGLSAAENAAAGIYRLVVPVGAAAVPCISVLGLTQHARTRSGMPSPAFGSGLPCRMTQRNAAWMCPAGQPKRS